jgi:hypothetical protein
MNTKADHFTTRELCTVLAALRLFQQVRPCDLCPDGTPIIEMEEFNACTPLDLDEIDELYERIRPSEWPVTRPDRSGLRLVPRPPQGSTP